MLIHFQKFGRNFNFKFPIIMDYSMRFIPAIKIIGNQDHNFMFLKFFKEILEFWNFNNTYWKLLFCPEIRNLLEKIIFDFLGFDFFIKNLEHSGNISNYWNLKQKNITKFFQFRAIFFHINKILVKYLPSFVKFWLESFQILFL